MSSTTQVGCLGEDLVAHWLQIQGWTILQRRWRCRWGEIDLIAQAPQEGAQAPLAFVEVKTRSQGNWDANGLLAITAQKQAKLCQTAQLFLAAYPALANLPCRFDVALVCCQRSRSISRESRNISTGESPSVSRFPTPTTRKATSLQMPAQLRLGQPVSFPGYQLTLQSYLEAAFDV